MLAGWVSFSSVHTFVALGIFKIYFQQRGIFFPSNPREAVISLLGILQVLC